jgi:sigma-B regulation protein RsbU (phosphoserine phosphatase)
MDDEFPSGTLHLDPALLGEPAPAEEIGHYLVPISVGDGKRIQISEAAVTIGRSPDQTLVILDTSVSRRHARISIVSGEVVAEDLGSTNGTFVNGARLKAPCKLEPGSAIKVGDRVFRYERWSTGDVKRREALDRELADASEYVLSLLPAPISDGPVQTEWRFVPSTQLGGDAFGYYWLDENTFVLFMIDVSGHGVGAAMHSVAVVDVLRQRAMPDVDWRDPGQVLANLNNRFQMDRYHGMLFTMWYGVYEVGARMLSYGTAGHHPAYLLTPGQSAVRPLGGKAMMIGAVPDLTYSVDTAPIQAGSVLYLFSDGAFEITLAAGGQWALKDFVALIGASPALGSESDRLLQAVRRSARPGPLEDDCSIVVATFS